MYAMHDVLRLVSRYLDNSNPEALDRQGKLTHCLVLVAIFHLVMCIYTVKMEQVERAHPRIIHDVDIQFTLQVAPPERIIEQPKSVQAIPEPSLVPMTGSITGGGATQANGKKVAESAKGNSVTEDQTLRVPDSYPVPVQPPVLTQSPNQVKAPTTARSEQPKDSSGIKGKEDGEANNDKIAGSEVTVGDEDKGKIGSKNGTGSTDREGSGADENDLQLEPVAVEPPTSTTALGNISPYRKRMLMALAQNWQPNKYAELQVIVVLNQDGSVQQYSVIKASSKKAVAEFKRALETTEFPPLPDWYKGDKLSFFLTVTSESLKSVRMAE